MAPAHEGYEDHDDEKNESYSPQDTENDMTSVRAIWILNGLVGRDDLQQNMISVLHARRRRAATLTASSFSVDVGMSAVNVFRGDRKAELCRKTSERAIALWTLHGDIFGVQ